MVMDRTREGTLPPGETQALSGPGLASGGDIQTGREGDRSNLKDRQVEKRQTDLYFSGREVQVQVL